MIAVKRVATGVYESPCKRIKILKHVVTSSKAKGKRGSAAEVSWEPFIDGVSCHFDQTSLKDAVMIANRRIKEGDNRADPTDTRTATPARKPASRSQTVGTSGPTTDAPAASTPAVRATPTAVALANGSATSPPGAGVNTTTPKPGKPSSTPTTTTATATPAITAMPISSKGGQHRSPPVTDLHTEICEKLGVPSRVFKDPATQTGSAQMLQDAEARDARRRDQLAKAVMPKIIDKAVAAGVLPKGTGLAAKLAPNPAQVDTAPHVIVTARAGSGKTTTLIEGLKELMGTQSTLTPSPQQRAVWDAICLSRGKVRTVCFCAFNKPIQLELQKRVPTGCEAYTLHALGFKAINRAFRDRRLEMKENRVQDIILDLLGIGPKPMLPELADDQTHTPAVLAAHNAATSAWFAKRVEKQTVIGAVDKLVGLCKVNLVDPTIEHVHDERLVDHDALAELADYYDVECNSSHNEIFMLVPMVLAECKNVTTCIDFTDMIWLPVVLNLPVFKFDLLLVDEAQDLSRCQQALAMRVGKRLILCGDPMQAIYGFCGADADSMPRMQRELTTDCPRCGASGEAAKSVCKCGEQLDWTKGRGCDVLPLTVTRRCGKAIVKEANRIVPDFHAHDTCPEGSVSRVSYAGEWMASVRDGDMVLCRTNAPLVTACFGFIKRGKRAGIQGRDVGQGLITTVKKLKATTVADLIARLDGWLDSEQRKENAKKSPSEQRLTALADRRDCIVCFTDGLPSSASPDEVVRKIESVFTDNRESVGIRLSSIHKAKGLEAKRVFILQPPMFSSRTDKQESNLRYVAITRAIEELIYVS